jgi:hypothetical protein
VDKERQFFKSQFGLPEDLAQARQTPRDVSVCSQVVAMDDVLVIEDLARERRFARNSLVKERGLRFYAGAPLRTTGGHVLGALCVLDTKPRHFGDHDKRLLEVMAEEVMGLSAQLRICIPFSVLALLAADRTDFKKRQTIVCRATARPLAFSAKAWQRRRGAPQVSAAPARAG